MDIGRTIVVLCASAAALTAVAGCAPQGTATVPSAAADARPAPADRPDTRGKVRLWEDLYADPLPMGIVAGPDGALWFTETANGIIGRMTTRGNYTMHLQVGGGVSDGITVGPDKNLWFTGSNGSGPAIGRITTANVVTWFPDTGGYAPLDITNGPDGALWFTEYNGTVGRITTQGAVTHFTVAASNAELAGIASGPDGHLWVTQYVVGGSRFSDKVIRLSTKGNYTSYTVGSGPDFICVGPDKALWFTLANSNALGRLTTAGKYKEFPTGYEYAQPSGIATGPDGALWFTDFSGRAGIGRMTTAGKTQFYKVPGSFPELVEITNGPDHAMWFTSDIGPSGIGRVTTK